MTPSPPTKWLPVRVESMAEADLEPVLDIEYLSFSSPWPRDIFLGELRGSDIAQLFVARILEGDQQGRVAAYSCTWIIADEMHITSFAVHPPVSAPAYRPAADGRYLARALESGCRQAGARGAGVQLCRSAAVSRFGFLRRWRWQALLYGQ